VCFVVALTIIQRFTFRQYPSSFTSTSVNNVSLYFYFFTVEPEINMPTLYRFREGLIITCSLKRSNPAEVEYTWYSCNTPKCAESLTKQSILRLDSQPKSVMKYQCKAKNAAGSASKTIEVFKYAGNNSKSIKMKLQTQLCAIQYICENTPKITNSNYDNDYSIQLIQLKFSIHTQNPRDDGFAYNM
jgi:hypothetical protein